MSFIPRTVASSTGSGNEPSLVSGGLVDQSSSQTFTNKTIDSADNVLKIDGVTVTGSTGSGGILVFSQSPLLITPDLRLAVTTISSSPYAPTNVNEVILVDCSGGNITINLPTAIGASGNMFIIKKIDSTANSIIVDPFSTQTIDGSATATFSVPNTTIYIVSNNANWFII